MGLIQNRSGGIHKESRGTEAIARGLGLIAIAATIAATFATAAFAALEPGVPVAVPPGVPGNGRAWELVTTPDPDSAILESVRDVAQSGSAVAYVSSGAIGGAPSRGAFFPTNIARRSADGWLNTIVPVPFPEGSPVNLLAFDRELESSVWTGSGPDSEAFPGRNVGVFRRSPAGIFSMVGVIDFPEGSVVGASPDLQHLVFTSEAHLLPADEGRTSGRSVYEVVGSSLRLVDVGGDGLPLSDCGSSISTRPNPLSSDGRRIFFGSSPGCAGQPDVYLRSDGVTTTEISTSQCGLPDCGPEAPVYFAGATPDGSQAFLFSEERLTDADSNTHADLYRYDVADGDLTLISSGSGGPDLAPTKEPVRVSADGSRVYFLAAGQPPTDPPSPSVSYLADASGVKPVPGAASLIQVAGDGRFALYSTDVALVPGDSDESFDVYRYDAEDGSTRRISTGPAGGNGAFDAYFEGFFGYLGHHGRRMSEDGSHIIFNTGERLLPEDHNETPDVYEWFRGELGLITPGTPLEPGEVGSYFKALLDPDGTTAFFASGATLVPQDRDGGDIDIYAARLGGGFPEPSPPACSGSSCFSPAGRQVERPVPATARKGGGGIRLARVGPAARRRAATTGWITLLAEVPAAGRLSVEARATVGGRTGRMVAAATVAISRPGPARVRMRLSEEARRALAKGRDLRLRLRLRLTGLDTVRRARFELRGRR